MTVSPEAPLEERGTRIVDESPVVEVEHASKWYGDKVAVSDLSFTLGPGVTTLLGPNGAGKTTTLRMLAGLLRPSQGSVRVLGHPIFDNPPLYRHIGLVPEQDALYPFLTARQFVELAARLEHLPDPGAAAQRALGTVDLLDVQDRKLGGYSKGMRQRAKIAQALVHDPQVLILDEPLSGADPAQRLELMHVFTELSNQGKTVLISSHILYEAERMGTRVLVIVEGKLAAEGDYHAIRSLMDDRPRRVAIACTNAREIARLLIGLEGTCGLEITDQGLVVQTVTALDLYRAVPRAAQQAGAHLYSVEGLDEDLESVFRYLVGS
ncbi:MAG TPA: ABC transporter ATP-binding protein [Chloroflexota bacterium]